MLPNDVYYEIIIRVDGYTRQQMSAANKLFYRLIIERNKHPVSDPIKNMEVIAMDMCSNMLYKVAQYSITMNVPGILYPFIRRGISWDNILLAAAKLGNEEYALKALANGAVNLNMAILRAYANGMNLFGRFYHYPLHRASPNRSTARAPTDIRCYNSDHQSIINHIGRYGYKAEFSLKHVLRNVNMETFKIIFPNILPGSKLSYYASKYKRYDILDFLHSVDYKDTQGEFQGACRSGNINAVMQFINNGYSVTVHDVHRVCASGSYELFKIMHKMVDREGLLKYSAKKGRYIFIKYLIKHYEFDHLTYNKAFENACKYGSLNITKLLLNKGPRVSIYAVIRACKSGNIDLAKLLYAHGAIFNGSSLENATRKGHHGIVRFLLDIGIRSDYAIIVAIDEKRFNIAYMLISVDIRPPTS